MMQIKIQRRDSFFTNEKLEKNFYRRDFDVGVIELGL